MNFTPEATSGKAFAADISMYRQEFEASDGHGVISIPWSCWNGSGASLNNGIYAVRVTASYNGGKTHSRQKKFVLWRNN